MLSLSLSLAFVYPADPMCCTTPSGIAPSRRGRIAPYNGPLHNGIRTCDIYLESQRRESATPRVAARRCPGDQVAGISGVGRRREKGEGARDLPRDTDASCIKERGGVHSSSMGGSFLSCRDRAIFRDLSLSRHARVFSRLISCAIQSNFQNSLLRTYTHVEIAGVIK